MRRVKSGHWLSCLLIGALALCCYKADAQKRPPNYSQDDMPVTSFNCHDKVVGGYYADPETDCQMFHVCVHIPGVGIQNFRFLCPNDTSFDQEHQICDDWFNIDCELSSLYYSDNFDLYRIGVNHDVKKPPASHKGTPIPLGPSTTQKPYQLKKNQYSDEDDDFKRGGNDILRGSHSSNFYASKNRGRDDLDSDYATPNTGAQRQDVNQPTDAKKQKTLVRKLAGKRPVTQRPTTAYYTDATTPPATATTNFPQRSSNFNQYAGNKVPVAAKSRGNVNFSTYTTKASKQPEYRYSTTASPTIYQKINNLTEFESDRSHENPATPVFDVSKTYKNAYNFRIQAAAFQPKSSSPKAAAYPSSTVAPIAQTESLRLPSTEYLQNIAQTYQQPAALINNQLQDTSRVAYQQPPQPQQPQYDQYKKTQTAGTQSAFANYNNEYQQYNNYRSPASAVAAYQTTARAANPSAPSSTYYTATTASRQPSTQQYSYQSYSTAAPYVQPNATTVFDYYKYYQTSTATPKARTYYSPSPTFNYYTSSPTAAPAKYDPYATFQKANEKYDDDEFLKTAPSSNLKPSDLNAIHNQKKQQYINATLKAAYSVDPPTNSFSFYQPSTPAKSSPPAAQTAVVSAKATQSKTPVAAAPAKTSTPAATKTSQHDYDYAYYDNAGSSEYDQVDAVDEDFARINKVQKS